MKKWKKLTVALAGIAACVGLIGSPAMVQAKEDSAKAVLQTQTVSESKWSSLYGKQQRNWIRSLHKECVISENDALFLRKNYLP